MDKYGFVKVAAAVPAVKVADVNFNTAQTEKLLRQAVKEQAEMVVFPELGITSSTCGDLFLKPSLIERAELELAQLLNRTQTLPLVFMVGLRFVRTMCC